MLKTASFWLRTIIIVMIVWLLSKVTSIYLPVILALILSFLLNSVVDLLVRLPARWGRRQMPRSIAVLLSFVVAVFAIVIVALFIVFPFIQEFDKFVIDLPGLVRRIQFLIVVIEQQATAMELPDNVRDLLNQGVANMASFSVEMAKRILNAVFGFASQAVELVVVPVLIYYLLKDWRSLQLGFINAFSPQYRQQLQNVTSEMGNVISGYIRGQIVISIIMGVLVFSGMYLLGVDYPLVLGLLATLTETIPIIGPVIGAIPAILLAYIISPALAVKVIVFYILIQQIENHLIVPNIMGHTIDLHPIVVVISLLIGGHIYGVAGMMLAVPVTALLRVVIRHLWYYGESR
ncbi:putative PurR-regulated permease PerM [Anaerospora hongkongensis]|uniref:Putative PurR-regulated permease PerM n=1 Tax=Anaerospora hongkongensis TaxID=244830 RepID=A0A4R1Q3K7_9FIRM|nr:AI-2E family transporter [Anaerospora hongkongensis]TCL35832.1 putative PurR-regulated permease PerM [Anaerospora hongkongensis]